MKIRYTCKWITTTFFFFLLRKISAPVHHETKSSKRSGIRENIQEKPTNPRAVRMHSLKQTVAHCSTKTVRVNFLHTCGYGIFLVPIVKDLSIEPCDYRKRSGMPRKPCRVQKTKKTLRRMISAPVHHETKSSKRSGIRENMQERSQQTRE